MSHKLTEEEIFAFGQIRKQVQLATGAHGTDDVAMVGGTSRTLSAVPKKEPPSGITTTTATPVSTVLQPRASNTTSGKPAFHSKPSRPSLAALLKDPCGGKRPLPVTVKRKSECPEDPADDDDKSAVRKQGRRSEKGSKRLVRCQLCAKEVRFSDRHVHVASK